MVDTINQDHGSYCYSPHLKRQKLDLPPQRRTHAQSSSFVNIGLSALPVSTSRPVPVSLSLPMSPSLPVAVSPSLPVPVSPPLPMSPSLPVPVSTSLPVAVLTSLPMSSFLPVPVCGTPVSGTHFVISLKA